MDVHGGVRPRIDEGAENRRGSRRRSRSEKSENLVDAPPPHVREGRSESDMRTVAELSGAMGLTVETTRHELGTA